MGLRRDRCEIVFQGLPLDEGHHQVGELALLAVGEHRHDVLVLEHAHLLGFLAEARHHRSVARELREHRLQGADPADRADLLADLVDDAHAAEAEHLDDLVFVPDLGAGREDGGNGHSYSRAQTTVIAVALSLPPARLAAAISSRHTASGSSRCAVRMTFISSSESIPETPSLHST